MRVQSEPEIFFDMSEKIMILPTVQLRFFKRMARIYALGFRPSFKNGSLARHAKWDEEVGRKGDKVFFFVLSTQFSNLKV